MVYSIKECYYTLQGEGAQCGRPAVFLRFAGCNLWTGREVDRARAVCRFCDTDFVGVDGTGGGKFASVKALAEHVDSVWSNGTHDAAPKFVVCTGGEPLLQLDTDLVSSLQEHGFSIAVETNGTLPVPSNLDWICVSPKGSAELRILKGNELKLVYPQLEEDAQPEKFSHLDFEHFFLQPLDGPDVALNTRMAIDYCLRNPKWRLSIQMHKSIGIP